MFQRRTPCNRYDRLFYQNQVGYRDIRTKERILPNSIFNLGSISKPFTSVAVLQLQEKGLLTIDDMVVNYIPECRFGCFFSGRRAFLVCSENIYSCLGDLVKFDEALRNNKILGREMQEMSYTPFVFSSGDTAKDMNAPIPSYYGLGWFISINQSNGKIIWHKGISIGSRSVFLRNPAKRQVVGATDNFDYTAVDLKGIACLRILNHESYLNPVLISLVQKFGCDIYSNGFFSALSDFKVLKATERQNYYISGEETIQLMNDLVNDKKSTDALSLMQYSTELFPTSPEFFIEYGKLLLDAGSKEEAVSNFKQAVLLPGLSDQEREAILNNVRYAFLVLNQFDKAELVLKLNTELFPGSGNVYDSYASALEKNNKICQAIQMEKKAITIATLNKAVLLKTFEKNLVILESKN